MSLNLDEVRQYILNSTPDSKIYIGGDSERFIKGGKWYADYAVAIVVHLSGKHGCKVFGEVTCEPDYDNNLKKPITRLMQEVYKVQDIYSKLEEVIGDRYCEIHLDINPSRDKVSSCVIDQAIGYIKGTCNITPKVKPHAPAASICADRLKEVIDCK